LAQFEQIIAIRQKGFAKERNYDMSGFFENLDELGKKGETENFLLNMFFSEKTVKILFLRQNK